MKYRSLTPIPGLLMMILVCRFTAEGQGRYHLGSQMRPVDSSKDIFTLEGDALLNPIYISQFSSNYWLNSKPFPLNPPPKFYALQTGQNAFLGSTPFSIISDLGQIGDQANAGYVSIRLWFLDHTRSAFFHDMRFKFGVTHDKMQTNAPNVTYGYNDGGTELTFLLEKRVFKKLSDLDLKTVNLMLNMTVQAGILFPWAAVKPVVIVDGDSIIKPASTDRWQSIGFNKGWGWQTGLKVDIGGVLCHEFFISRGFTQNCWLGHEMFCFFRRLGITVGTRLVLEELYSKPQVLYNGQPGYQLKMDNFCFFFSGPVLSFKWLSLK